MNVNKEKAKEVLRTTERAGFQLVKERCISKEVLATISQPVVSERELGQWYDDQYEKAENKNTA